MQFGHVRTSAYDKMFFAPEEKINLAQQFNEFVNSPDKTAYLNALEPKHPDYQILKAELKNLRDFRKEGRFPKISGYEGGIIYIGDEHNIIPDIRNRLNNSYASYDGHIANDNWVDHGRIKLNNPHQERNLSYENGLLKQASYSELTSTDYKEPETSSFVYDDDLAQKVAEFQYAHGLKTDGVIGPQTVEAMNQGADEKIQKLRLSMERLRWLPQDMGGDKYVFLNIPTYQARTYKNNQLVFTMPVIVGEVAHQTPEFSSVIKNVKMHPDWTAPDSIARRYLMGKIQNNPSVIDRLGYQVQSKRTGEIIPWNEVDISRLHKLNLRNYQFRQKPGNHNALGLARFSIENPYSIFMHGTPQGDLFNRSARTFSSGCVRLEDPLKMAKFLLIDEGMSEEKIEQLYKVNDNQTAKSIFLDLKKDIPVHIVYNTAWADTNGNIHYAPDIYGRDKKLSSLFSDL